MQCFHFFVKYAIYFQKYFFIFSLKTSKSLCTATIESNSRSPLELDKLLTYYYQLTDEGREEVNKYVEERYALKKDAKRGEDIKQITKW